MANNTQNFFQATPVDPTEIEQIKNIDVFRLQPENPKMINKADNKYAAYIHEYKPNENIDEHLFIYSQFDDENFAIVGNEFYSKSGGMLKRVDVSYYYFGEEIPIYLYDMKKNLAGKKNINHLILQWKSSIKTAEYCMSHLGYKQYDIKIGVITEDAAAKKRKEQLQQLLQPPVSSTKVPSFIKSNRNATSASKPAYAKVLEKFNKRKVTIDGTTYEFDIREFDDIGGKKEHHMYFVNGVLQ